MGVPKVAIVGRPNVGKSSLLNWLAGKRISVVDPMSGVTRDRVTYLMHEKDRYFELVDTGGIGIVDRDDLSADIDHQIQVGIEEAALILFVVDGKTGVANLDIDVAGRLRKMDTPLLMVINKCDSPRQDKDIAEFYKLTDAPVICTSVKSGRNLKELLEKILGLLPLEDEAEQGEGEILAAEPELKLAIVGRRNVGKSTFINALAETDRMIVSEVAGTTRDSVDIHFEMDGKSFTAIDTPGVRKKKSLAGSVEWYGLARAKRSVRRANVVLMFFDVTETISRVDKQLVDEIVSHHKPCIFVVNKWDLADDMTSEKWGEYLFKQFAMMRHVPIAFVTALQQKNVKKLINLAQTIHKQACERVPTAKINTVLRAAIVNNPPPRQKNRRPKIFYGTQVSTEPPTIVLKCNDPKLFTPDWKRYLLGVFREKLPFQEVPIQLYMRSRLKREEGTESLEDLPSASAAFPGEVLGEARGK